MLAYAGEDRLFAQHQGTAGLLDRHLHPGGDALALGTSSAIHFGSMLGMVENLGRRYPLHELRPGDVFLTNDPYIGGGSHLPDLTATSPVFHDGRLVGFVASLAHHSDIGGKVAGSESADCTSIFQEGLRIPPVRLASGGVLCEDILEFILINSRTPGERPATSRPSSRPTRWACEGFRDVRPLRRRFGLAAVEALLDYSEARARAEIARMPDGRYENEVFLDHDGIGEAAVRLKVAVTIAGDRIEFDIRRHRCASCGRAHCVLNATEACVYQVVKVVADPGLPPNAGYFRAIGVTVPPGSVLNCSRRPRSGIARRRPTCSAICCTALCSRRCRSASWRAAGRAGNHLQRHRHRRNGYFVDYEIYAGVRAPVRSRRQGRGPRHCHTPTARRPKRRSRSSLSSSAARS